MSKIKHILFYDAQCQYCRNWAWRISRWDKAELFAFASLKGKTAEKYGVLQTDSIVLLEDFDCSKKFYVKSKAIFRIFWLLGKRKKMVGILFFLPSFLFDWGYHLVAANRPKDEITGGFPPRFLS